MFLIIARGTDGSRIMAHGPHRGGLRRRVTVGEIHLHHVQTRITRGKRLRMRRHVRAGEREHMRPLAAIHSVGGAG